MKFKKVEELAQYLRWYKSTDDGDYKLQYWQGGEWIDVPFVFELP